MVRPRKAHEERRQWGAENNDDERTRTRDFIAGERGASERDADADQRDANECDADEQETDGFLRQSRRGRERLGSVHSALLLVGVKLRTKAGRRS